MDVESFISSIEEQNVDIQNMQSNHIALKEEYDKKNEEMYHQFLRKEKKILQNQQNIIRERNEHIVSFLIDNPQWYYDMDIMKNVLESYYQETELIEYTGEKENTPLIAYFQELFYSVPLVEQMQPLIVNVVENNNDEEIKEYFPSPWIFVHSGTQEEDIEEFCNMFSPYVENIKKYYEKLFGETIDIPLHFRMGNIVFNICLMLHQDNTYSVVETDYDGNNIVYQTVRNDLISTLKTAVEKCKDVEKQK